MEKKLTQEDLAKLKNGPIRHETLPDELLDQIRTIHQVTGKYFGQTLEQAEIDFMRDAHPEREIAIWMHIVRAFLKYREMHVTRKPLNVNQGRKIIGALSAISMGRAQGDTLLASQGLKATTEQNLIRCYYLTA
jgi:hypothetical protein